MWLLGGKTLRTTHISGTQLNATEAACDDWIDSAGGPHEECDRELDLRA